MTLQCFTLTSQTGALWAALAAPVRTVPLCISTVAHPNSAQCSPYYATASTVQQEKRNSCLDKLVSTSRSFHSFGDKATATSWDDPPAPPKTLKCFLRHKPRRKICYRKLDLPRCWTQIILQHLYHGTRRVCCTWTRKNLHPFSEKIKMARALCSTQSSLVERETRNSWRKLR